MNFIIIAMSGYAALSKQFFGDIKKINIRTIDIEFSEKIRLWRNDQINVLRQKSMISSTQQEKYYLESIYRDFDNKYPPKVLFNIFEKDQLVGYGGLVYIDWRTRVAEISFLVNPIYKSSEKYDFIHIFFLELIIKVAKDELLLEEIFTETFSFRSAHIKNTEKCGFKMQNGCSFQDVNKRFESDSVFHSLRLKK